MWPGSLENVPDIMWHRRNCQIENKYMSSLVDFPFKIAWRTLFMRVYYGLLLYNFPELAYFIHDGFILMAPGH